MSALQAMSGASNDCGYEAAEWFVRLQTADLSNEDLQEWERWIASPANRAAFDDIQHIRLLAERSVGAPTSRSGATVSELAQDRYDGSMPVAEWLAQRKLEAERARNLSRGTTSRFAAFAAIAAVVATGVLLWASGRLPGGASGEHVEGYETIAAEHRDIALPDGSMIVVGAKSAVSVSFSAERRVVNLARGEAWFQVARDVTRPFVVVAGGGSITAVGTAFNVRRDAEEVGVTVTEGRVDVVQAPTAPADSTKPMTATVVAGQEVSYSVGGELREVKRADPEVAVAWREGRLEYRRELLKRVIPDVNRYLRQEIVVVDPEIGDYMFTGTVLQTHADGWMRGLEEIYPVEVVDTGDNRILVRKREGS